MADSKKVLILTYYWPPSGGSGVQRWVYFAKYLKRLGWEPIVITVDETKAAYAVKDPSLEDEVNGIRVVKTSTREPLRWYSWLTTGHLTQGIPQGEVPTNSLFKKMAAYIRGNFFIPDARKGWVPFAVKAASGLLKKEGITHLITTGPPHSTHLAGLHLKAKFTLNWWVDFRDPWSSVFYNQQMQRNARSDRRDRALELEVLTRADGVITTIGGSLHQDLRQKVSDQKLVALPNGYDKALIDSCVGQPPDKAFHLVYTGLLTRQQAFGTIVAALQQLTGRRPIRFSLAGKMAPDIVAEIKAALPQVEVIDHGYLTHTDAVQLMKSAHLLLNFIFKGAQKQMISGKLLEYLSTEVPILSIGDPLSAAGQFLAQGSNAKMLAEEDHQGILTYVENHYKGFGQKNIFPQLEQWSRLALTKRLIKEVLYIDGEDYL
ncbi:MAG: hypothetical protein ACPH63_02590 [Flavobacteriaceae bacterium]